jgi:hypothetical protein
MAPHDTPILMLPAPPRPVAAPDALAARIEGAIARQAGGRITDLRVTCEGGLIVLEGRARTYYAKQLAHQVVLGLVDDAAGLANQIAVS